MLTATPTHAAPEPAAAEARRLTTLRLQLLDNHPFWGHLLLQLRLIAAPELPTFAATDCVSRIWYNPQLTRHLALDQLGFVLAHELGHHLLESLARRHERASHLWNCATDYAINRMVTNIRGRDGEPLYRLPDGTYPGLGRVAALYDPRFDGMTAEQIYDRLEADALPTPTIRRAVRLSAAHPDYHNGDHHGDHYGDHDLTDHGGGIDLHLPRPASDTARGQALDHLTAAMAGYDQDHRRGQLPGGVERLLAPSAAARLPWQRLLARYVGGATSRHDYTYARPNLRWWDHDILVPGLRTDDPGRIVVAVDTSASMTPAQLRAVASELASLHAVAPELTVLIADAKVHAEIPARALPAFLARQTLRGGGGTNHIPVFDWITKRCLEPELFIGLTDLRSLFPPSPPRYPVLWITPARHGQAPWGTVVTLDA